MLFTVFSCLISAQTPDRELTGHMFNGRAWNGFASETKLGYVLAAFDAVHYDDLVGVGSKKSNGPSPFKLTAGFSAKEYIEKLDALYSDADNIRIPLPFALNYCSADLGGDISKQHLELLIMNLRNLATTLTN